MCPGLSSHLFQDPLISVLLNTDWSLLIQADATRIQDSRRQDCVRNGWKSLPIVFKWFRQTCVDVPSCIDEFLDRYITVAPLTIEMTVI